MIETSAKRLIGPAIRLHPNDNVVVARVDVAIGTPVPGENFSARSQVPAGYKIAARKILKGEPILKYSVTVGFAHTGIEAGSMVHSHNTEFREFDRDYAHASEFKPVALLPEAERATFQGYVRANGQVGTRNFIGLLSTVNCSATVIHKIAEWFTPERLAVPNVGVVAFNHSIGCGMEMTAQAEHCPDHGRLCPHPNLAAAMVISLGERNQLKGLMEQEHLRPARLHTFIMQETGGTRKTIEAGIAAVRALLPEANKGKRQTVSASHLCVGLQCGGSDGFSSITANPALGAAVDILARHGGR
jgi:altronate hydrolase